MALVHFAEKALVECISPEMKLQTKVEAGPLLLAFLEATDQTHAERMLAELIQDHADPIIAKILKSKLRVSMNGSHGDQLNQDALDIASELRSTLIADLRSLQQRPAATQDFRIKTRVYNFLAGPEFKARNRTRLTPFAHVLAGMTHTSASFTTPGPTFNITARTSHNGFAMGMGGGLDIRASKRVSFRAQMDYNPVFTGDRGSRDFARLSLGVLFH
jgi:hypothetical protein